MTTLCDEDEDVPLVLPCSCEDRHVLHALCCDRWSRARGFDSLRQERACRQELMDVDANGHGFRADERGWESYVEWRRKHRMSECVEEDTPLDILVDEVLYAEDEEQE